MRSRQSAETAGKLALRRIEELDSDPRERLGELSRYLRHFRGYPILREQADFDALHRQYRLAKGEQKTRARDLLVYGNIRLVVWVARRYVGRGVPLSDLLQEGVLGVMRAIDLFDQSRGTRFSSYAVSSIRRRIRRVIEDANERGAFRIPKHLQTKMRQISQVENHLTKILGRPATNREILDRLGESPAKTALTVRIADILYYQRRWKRGNGKQSLDAPLLAEGLDTRTLHDVVGDLGKNTEVLLEAQMLLENHERALENLVRSAARVNARDGMLLSKRLGLGNFESATLKETGAEVGVSRERIRQIERCAAARVGLTVSELWEIVAARERLVKLVSLLAG
ncbi:sigma-70 family RNA polymerase sigma factor [Patescibacteria group bacterium]|nr:MAG: sigma-70 family RNA polymerase sigma factor [Patescibacteria group bacterium]